MNVGYVHTLETPPNYIDRGRMRVSVFDRTNNGPVPGARVRISYTGEPDSLIEETYTNADGQVDLENLSAPPVEYSMEPGEEQPYSEYTVQVDARGYDSVNVSGSEVFSGETNLQNICLRKNDRGEQYQNIVIPANTLFGNYPPKIAEQEIKPVNAPGEIVLSRVVVPEIIVVHDGVPTDSTATDYYVRYRDYIKNVASSEIYSTWPRQTIEANILAIMSFTLNRVYTEW